MYNFKSWWRKVCSATVSMSLVALLMLSTIAQAAATPSSSSQQVQDDGGWVLSTTNTSKDYAPTFVGNGYLAARVPATGAGFSSNPIVTQFQLAGFYGAPWSGAEARASLPSWTTLSFGRSGSVFGTQDWMCEYDKICPIMYGAISGGAIVETEHAGSIAGGYLAGLNNGGPVVGGTGKVLIRNVPEAGTAKVNIRFANGSGSAQTVHLAVNGELQQLSLPHTGGWGTWGMATVTVTLNQGENTLAITVRNGDTARVNVDYLAVYPDSHAPTEVPSVSCSFNQICPAIYGTMTGGATIATDHTGSTVAGFLAGLQTVGATGTVTIKDAPGGPALLDIRYANGSDSEQTIHLGVNNASQQLTLPVTGSWDSWSVATVQVTLNEGVNTLKITNVANDTARVNVDYLAVYPGVNVAQAPTDVPSVPCNFNQICPAIYGTMTGGAHVEADHPGSTVGGFLAGLSNVGATGAITVTDATYGDALLDIRYASNWNDFETIHLRVNGAPQQLNLPKTGSWDTWGVVTVTVTLEEGVNTLEITTLDGDPADTAHVNVDYLAVYPKDSVAPSDKAPWSCSFDQLCPALYGTKDGGATVASDHSGSIVGSFLAGLSTVGATSVITVNGAPAGDALLDIRYASNWNDIETIQLSVNGETEQVSLPKTGSWDSWGVVHVPVTLVQGVNTLVISNPNDDSAHVNVDYLAVYDGEIIETPTLTAPWTCSFGQVCPAIYGTLQNGATVETNHPGSIVGGFLAGLSNPDKEGEGSVTTVNGAPAGDALLDIRYANGMESEETIHLGVNGVTQQLSLPKTGGWDKWGVVHLPVTLVQGVNTLEVTALDDDSARVNVDYLAVYNGEIVETPTHIAPAIMGWTCGFDQVCPVKYGDVSGGAFVETEHSGATDGGYIAGLTVGATGAITIKDAPGGPASLNLRYANGMGSEQTIHLRVNGELEQLSLPATGGWDKWGVVTVPVTLNAGENTLEITVLDGDTARVNVDALSVYSVGDEAPTPSLNATVPVGTSSNYRQSLDMRTGVLSTSFDWTSPDGDTTSFEYEINANREDGHLGTVSLKVVPHWSGTANVLDEFDGRGLHHASTTNPKVNGNTATLSATVVTDGSLVTAGLNSVLRINDMTVPTAAITDTDDGTVGQSAVLEVNAGQTYQIIKYVGIASSVDTDRSLSVTPQQAAAATAAAAAEAGYEEALNRNADAWSELWQSKITIPGDPTMTAQIRASMFYLLASMRSGVSWSTGPAGLSSDAYSGHVFWDMETWMYPALLAQYPDIAVEANAYRQKLLPAAKANAAILSTDAHPIKGAKFAWESGLTGKETAPDPWGKYELHINSDISLAQWQYYQVTGDTEWLGNKAWPVLKNIADYWVTRAVPNEAGGYDINDVMGPDEYHWEINNSAYTNASAQEALRIAIRAAGILGTTMDPKWKLVADGLKVPVDKLPGSAANDDQYYHPEFEGYSGQIIKQADVTLLQYPWDVPMTPETALNNLNYYAQKTDVGGPSMTDAIAAINCAALGSSECSAYDYMISSVDPFLAAPFNQFYETRNGGAFNFTTGQGGYLQEFLYGFTGLRWGTDSITIDPFLPTELPGVDITGLKWQGRTFDLSVGQQTTTLTLRSGAPLPVRVSDGNVRQVELGTTLEVLTRNLEGTGVSVTGVSLDKTSATLTAGETTILNATVAPDNASVKTVHFTSSAPTVATATNEVYHADTGLTSVTVTGVAAGTATITATTVDGEKTVVFTVTVVSGGGVSNPPVSSGTPNESDTPAGDNPGNVPIGAPVVESGTAKVAVDADALNKVLDKSTVALIEVPKTAGAKDYEVRLPAAALTAGEGKQIVIVTEFGTVAAPSNMLGAASGGNATDVALLIGQADTSKLDADTKAAIGNKPVIELSLKVNGSTMAWSNPEAPVTVSIPYTPTAEELANPEHITVWYIDGSGQPSAVPSGKYDPATGKVTFKTTHFSQYAVAYVQKSFHDLKGYGWAQNSIEVMASKGIIQGTSGDRFNPGADVKRADFILLLVHTLGLTAKTDGQFTDVDSGAYYAEAIAVAKKLGIAAGVGGNRFNPDSAITRQDMMVMIKHAMKAASKELAAGSEDNLSGFSDGSEVASYAKSSVSALLRNGIVTGNGNGINPRGNATRAETAVLMYRIYNK